jgi:hypothetical protein
LARIVLGTADTVAGSVYGTIVVMGAITVGAGGALDPWRLASAVAATVIVLWLAHVYSHGLGESIGRGRQLEREELIAIARRELAIPLAAVAPLVALFLGGIGLLRETSAVWLALGLGLAILAVQGFRYAALEHLGGRDTAKGVAVNLALGLGIIAMKVAVAH